MFDLVDSSATLEVDGVKKEDFWKVVDQCYLCDLCYMTKCPYVPPHPWNVDFPHLMLRAKAVKYKKGETNLRDKLLSSTDALGKLASIPVVVQMVNAVEPYPGHPHADGKLCWASTRSGCCQSTPAPSSAAGRAPKRTLRSRTDKNAPGKVAIFATCYVNYNEPGIGQDLLKVLEHNEIPAVVVEKENCCGMPKLELGDLDAVERLKNGQHPGAGEAGAGRLCDPHRDSFLYADVQAGAAAAVPATMPRSRRSRRRCSTRSSICRCATATGC